MFKNKVFILKYVFTLALFFNTATGDKKKLITLKIKVINSNNRKNQN